MAASRDILVLFRQYQLSETDMKREVQQLNNLLFTAERLDNFVRTHELFDLNRYRIISKSAEIKKFIRRKKTDAPFIFFSNKN